jgi:hypothetical protein
LTETKIAPLVANPILYQLGFTLMVQVPPSGTKGSLLLAWKTDVNISSFYVCNNIICIWYSSVDPVVKCLLSFVYCPSYKHLSLHFWHTLEGLGASHNDPWLCIGDFNIIISPDDKIGGRPYNSFISNPMFDFMSKFGMVDLSFFGNPFTWSNHRQGAGLIKECLDRSIANS